MKKQALALCLTASLAAVLGGCGAKKEQNPVTLSSVDTMLVQDGRLVLPAVKGHPAAAYFTLANQSGSAATLTGVSVAGAGKAEMHITQDGIMEAVPRLDIGAGQSVTFGPGGKHVMVFDVSPQLQAGGKTDITLIFANGHKLTAKAQIENPGMMPAMDHANMDHSKM